MPPVKETKSFDFSNVIVKPEDVRTLANIVVEVAEGQKSSNSRMSIEFSVAARGGQTFESTSVELFGKDGPLESKQVFSVGIDMWDFGTGARIRVILRHGNWESSHIEVVGFKSTWVNGAAHRLEVVVSEFEKQATWPRRFKPLFVIVGAFGIGHLWDIIQTFVEFHIIHIQPLASPPSWLVPVQPFFPVIDWGLQFSMGFFPSLYLTNKLLSLWPSAEFRMGREWHQLARERRNRLWLFITIVVAPLVLSFLYDLLKYWFR
jgi:hypothetical protein